MLGTRKKFYLYILLIFAQLFILEAALEFRHYRLGYTTPLFGTKIIADVNVGTNGDDLTFSQIKYGPTESFPFKSYIVPPSPKTEGYRFWIASASHAEGGRIPAEKVFPNRICEFTQLRSCDVINGSALGMTIGQNEAQLKKLSSTYQPDFVLLYQMSLIISGQQRSLTNGDTSDKVNVDTSNHGLVDISSLRELFQSFSLYVHLSDYVGGNIKLSGQLKNQMPDSMENDFRNQILEFITTCRELNLKPILITFAASHNRENLAQMPASERTNFVKYYAYLSADGWINTIERYNNVLREISKESKVPLIDLSQSVNGASELFIDFVHFNEAGHEKVAKIIAQELDSIVTNQEKYSGI